MPYETVEQPIPFPASFAETGDRAAQSQAAVLLLLSNLLRYEGERVREPLTVGAEPPLELIAPEEDREALNVRAGLLDLYQRRGERVDMRFARGWLAELDPRLAGPVSALEAVEVLPRIAAELAESPTPVAAAGLCETAMAHPDELVRVAAATAYQEICLPYQEEPAIAVLLRGTLSDDPLVFDVAATALARFAPAHPRLLELIRPLPAEEAGEPSRTGLLIHGTWSRQAGWWPPGGDFHSYVKDRVDPALYAAPDRFDWTGAWSHAARLAGGVELLRWAGQRSFAELDLFAHSHGGNVAMVANRAGLRIGRIVLLSCPVHAALYSLDHSRVGKAVAIRTRMDLVILADGGGQRFRDPRIGEIVLPIFFKHSVTRERETWIRHDLPSRI
jgi:hypothetical protein